MSGDLKLELIATSEEFDDDDPRWAAQLRTLTEALHRDAGDVRRVASGTAEGKKGDVSTIILALGTAGAFTAAVQIFNSFLARSTKRKIKLSTLVEGEPKIIELETEGLSATQTEQLVRELWPKS